MSRLRINLKAGKARTDPEKMILPGAMFCRSKQDGAEGFAISIGWWDYHATLLFAWPVAGAAPDALKRRG